MTIIKITLTAIFLVCGKTGNFSRTSVLPPGAGTMGNSVISKILAVPALSVKSKWREVVIFFVLPTSYFIIPIITIIALIFIYFFFLFLHLVYFLPFSPFQLPKYFIASLPRNETVHPVIKEIAIRWPIFIFSACGSPALPPGRNVRPVSRTPSISRTRPCGTALCAAAKLSSIKSAISFFSTAVLLDLHLFDFRIPLLLIASLTARLFAKRCRPTRIVLLDNLPVWAFFISLLFFWSLLILKPGNSGMLPGKFMHMRRCIPIAAIAWIGNYTDARSPVFRLYISLSCSVYIHRNNLTIPKLWKILN